MIVMVCVDDKNGMMFNKRRQSQDRVLRQHMLELAGDKKLWMNAYSRKQFPKEDDTGVVCKGLIKRRKSAGAGFLLFDTAMDFLEQNFFSFQSPLSELRRCGQKKIG